MLWTELGTPFAHTFSSHLLFARQVGKTIGVGVYCTPGLYTAEYYAGSGHTFEGHQIVFVMQCRVRPSAIKHVSDCATDPEAFWVVNDPKDIRPYRVLITKMNC